MFSIQINESASLFRVHIKKSTKLAPIQTLISAMFIKSSLCFTLIAVIIAGNGMARYLLVDVADEKGISDKRDGKREIYQRVINTNLIF